MSDFAHQLAAHRPEPAPVRDGLERRVFRATAAVLATTAAAYVLWLLVDVLLLLFACSLVALILLTVAKGIRRRVPMPFGVALAISVVGLLALIVGAFFFFGTTLQGEFAELATRLPAAWGDLQARLRASPVGAATAGLSYIRIVP